MAVCLDYQAVSWQRSCFWTSWYISLLVALALLFALSLRVWIKIESTRVGYDLARERERTIEYDSLRRDLELQVSLLKRPDNLRYRAKEVLGLGPLNPRQARKLTY